MLDAALQGLALVFSWPNILYPVIGTLLAMVVSFLPGVSGVTLMALALPLTFSWTPLEVVLLFGALVGGATFMGSVTAILFNVPGSAPSAATLIDGHPMARQGEARTALACAATASALGSTIGIVVLILLLPVIRPLLLAFGPLEFLLLCVWGLTTIAMVGGRPVRAWAMAGLGLALAFVGRDPRTADDALHVRHRLSAGRARRWCRSCSGCSRSPRSCGSWPPGAEPSPSTMPVALARQHARRRLVGTSASGLLLRCSLWAP